MRFGEKLARLTIGRNKQQVGRAAGLPATAVSDYIAKGHMPRADKGVSLARELDVSPAWLFDDGKDWPPPTAANTSVAALTSENLIVELASRYKADAVRIWNAIKRADQVEWDNATRTLLSLNEGEELPRTLTIPIHVSGWLMEASEKFEFYKVERWVDQKAEGEPSAPPDQLDGRWIVKRAAEIRAGSEAFALFYRAVQVRISEVLEPDERSRRAAERQRLMAQLDARAALARSTKGGTETSAGTLPKRQRPKR